MKEGLAGMDQAFSERHLDAVRQRIASIDKADFCRRLWRRDWTLWKEDDENRKSILDALGKAAGFRHVVHMGMGGSSLAPLAFQKMFEPGENGLPMTVLDTTDPATIFDIERSVPLARTLFIEASKSGTTVESRSFGEYFYHKVKEIKGEEAGDNFAVITDPGSMLDALARERRYRGVFLNFHDIGGRYSALSYFGLVPAALMGIDVREIMAGASNMMKLCGPDTAAGENPGVILGAMLGEMALQGRNKLTFLGPGCLTTLGMWLEQLVAESTGKEGKGIVPVPGEPVGLPEVYGEDRFFVRFHLETEPDEFLDQHVEGLEEAGHPVVTNGGSRTEDQSVRPAQRAGEQGFHPSAAEAGEGGRKTGRGQDGHGGRACADVHGRWGDDRFAGGVPFPGPGKRRRSPGHPGLSHGEQPGGGRSAGRAREVERQAAHGHDTGIRTALPAFDGSASQGRHRYGAFSAAYLR